MVSSVLNQGLVSLIFEEIKKREKLFIKDISFNEKEVHDGFEVHELKMNCLVEDKEVLMSLYAIIGTNKMFFDYTIAPDHEDDYTIGDQNCETYCVLNENNGNYLLLRDIQKNQKCISFEILKCNINTNTISTYGTNDMGINSPEKKQYNGLKKMFYNDPEQVKRLTKCFISC